MSASRQKGTAWATEVCRFLVARGWPNAEKRNQTGRFDRGDIAGVIGVVIEAKNEKRIDLAGYLREAQTEAINAKADIGVAWVKKRGKTSAGDGYVVMDGETFVKLLAAGGWQ